MLLRIEAVIGRPIGKLQGDDKSLCVSLSWKSLLLFQTTFYCFFEQDAAAAREGREENSEIDARAEIP